MPKVKRQGEVLVLIHILVLIVHGGGEPLPETEEEPPEGESNNILLISPRAGSLCLDPKESKKQSGGSGKSNPWPSSGGASGLIS